MLRFSHTPDPTIDHHETDFELYCKEIDRNYPSTFYQKVIHSKIYFFNSELELNWIDSLKEKGKTPEEAARIIERAFYIKYPQSR